MEEIKLPHVDGIPLDQVEGLERAFNHLLPIFRKQSVLLSPDGKSPALCIEISEATLSGYSTNIETASSAVSDVWQDWVRWRKAQVLNRPPLTAPNDIFLEKIVEKVASLAVRLEEHEKMGELVSKQREHYKALEPPHRRLGNCKLKPGSDGAAVIASCDGRIILNGGDAETAYFEDDGEALKDYLAKVKKEKAAAHERLKEQKRLNYHARKANQTN